MGGTSTSKQTQTSSTDSSNSATQNGSQSQSSTLAPGLGTAPSLNNIVGMLGGMAGSAGAPTAAQTGAINQLTANGQAGDPNAPAVSQAVGGLLNGGGATANNGAISNNLSQYQGLLNNYANGSMVGNNTALKSQLDNIQNDVTNQVNGQFAAAGRAGSPDNLMALGRGIAQGEAPVIAGQYNQDVANQLGAAGSLYGAGNTTYGMLNGANTQGNANIQAGIGADPAAYAAGNAGANTVLGAQSNLFGIPASQLTTLLGAISPVAQAFGTQNSNGTTAGTSSGTATGTSSGTATGSNTMSGAQQFGMLANGIGSLMPKAPTTFNFG